MFSQFASHPFRTQVIQHSYAPEPIVFNTSGGIAFGEALIVQVPDIPEPLDGAVRVRRVHGAKTELRLKVARGIGSGTQAFYGVIE